MRFLRLSLVFVAATLVITACNSKSSSSSDQSSASATSASDTTNAAATGAPDNSGASSPAAASPGSADNGAAAGEPPSYPGAQTQASGSSSNMGQSAAGKVLMSDDSFDKVYQWYQQNMPAGSEKSHVTAPIQSAVFMVGDPGKGQTSVTITTSGSKTMITIAHVKM